MRAAARRRRRRAGAAVLLVLGLVVATSSAATSAPGGGDASVAAAAGERWDFEYTGAPETWHVPDGVEHLTVLVVGAAGERGRAEGHYSGAGGGVSGQAISSWPVTPGEQLTIWVGGDAAAGRWGFGCGGDRGQGLFPFGDGGGGGGASAVSRGGTVAGPECDESTRPDPAAVLAVGGGGGGGGGRGAAGGQPGAGGDGGHPPTAGGYVANPDEAGCAGCRPGPDGQDGGGGDFGSGGGGGGWNGGGGGHNVAFSGAGGGGGSSYVAPGAHNLSFTAGTGLGSGYVSIIAGAVDVHDCTGQPGGGEVPDDAGIALARVQGAQGGSAGTGHGAVAGPGGQVDATFVVQPGEEYYVDVGCAPQGDHGGYGYGVGGHAGRAITGGTYDGGGGGGSSAVTLGADLMVGAGGGGGGGGFSQSGDYGHGEGGSAGLWPAAGASGAGGIGPWAAGGCGGCERGPAATGGGHADVGGGGGGGGGGARHGGRGGHGGRGIGGNGGGGGGGDSAMSPSAYDATFSTSSDEDGRVELVFITGTPAHVSVWVQEWQDTVVGTPFPYPLQAIVRDWSGRPVSGVEVTFSTEGEGGGPRGTFPDGGYLASALTGADGIATSPPVTADGDTGSWGALATVERLTPARFSMQNDPMPTAIVLDVTPQPVTVTEAVRISATVQPSSEALGAPAGEVTFDVQGVPYPVPLVEGAAVLDLDPGDLVLGTFTLRADYSGHGSFAPSQTSRPLHVVETPTAITLTSSANPSQIDQEVTFSAQVTVPAGNPLPPGPSVQLSRDGTPWFVGTLDVDGRVAAPQTFTSIGTATITAELLAGGGYAGSTASLVQHVGPEATGVHLQSSTNPLEYGQPLELEATVSAHGPPTPTGAVDLSTAGAPLCTAALDGGTGRCELATALEPGAHLIEGAYGGDAVHQPSAGSMVQQVTPARTTTTLTASPAAATTYGTPVVFTAHVAPSVAGVGLAPGGAVQLAIDGEPLGDPVPLSEHGTASSPPTLPPAGFDAVTATYLGDARHHPSTTALVQQVSPGATTSSVVASAEPSQLGQPVTFTSTVSVADGAAVQPEGFVQVRVDGQAAGDPVRLVDGQAASAPVEGLVVGEHHITTTFLPDAGFLPSSAGTVHVVNQPTVTLVSSAANPSTAGQPVEVTASVGPAATGGTVAFSVDGTAVAACQGQPVVGSQARCDLPALAAGAHEIVAVYSGAARYDGSEGSYRQQVDPAPPTPPVPPTPPGPPEPSGGGSGDLSGGSGSGRLPLTGASVVGLAGLGVLLLLAGLALHSASGRRGALAPGAPGST